MRAAACGSLPRGPEVCMNILLTAVNAKYIHSNPAVHSLRAYARKHLGPASPVRIGVAEYTVNHRTEDILASVYRKEPDVLCFSCYIWNIGCVTELAREFHKLRPDVPIWAGGPEVSYDAEAFLREHTEVTGVMAGEGERTFSELCEYYAGYGKEPDSIRGIFLRRKDTVVSAGAREALAMDEIPFYYKDGADFEHRIIYYESSRGCPFSCSYCLSSLDKSLRFRSLDLVFRELSFFLERNVPQVKFVDRTFNCRQDRAEKIWRFLLENDNGITNFHFEIAADLLTEEALLLLGQMRPGLVQLEIGVQSANAASLAEVKRTTDLKRLSEAVRRIRRGKNIHVHLDLIAGLPFEDYGSFAASFDRVYALRPDQLQLGFLKVLKGSGMRARAEDYGLLYGDSPPYEVLRTAWLDYPEIIRLKRAEEMLEVYYNSGQYKMTEKILAMPFQSAFALYESLGGFYEERGYSAMSHSRLRRAEILLEFTAAYVPAIADVIRESLIYDLYARENMKSRPSWAADATEWRELTRRYCRNGKQTHIERFFYRFSEEDGETKARIPGRETEPFYVLFDYTRRDPVSRQASISPLYSQ